MRYWELPNVFWGAVFAVWISLILTEYFNSPPGLSILFSTLFLALLLMILIFLKRGIETGKWLFHLLTLIFAIALVIATWISIKLLELDGIVKESNLARIAFSILIFLFWIISIECARYDQERDFKGEEGWYKND